jgi:RNA polymerase sigma factor (sigma-70 family)
VMDGVSPGFEEWYAREHASVVRALAVIAGEADVAGEVVAEAFSRAFERWDRVGALANPTGWVYRVAVNLLRRRWRRSAVERRLLIRRAAPAPWAEAELVPEVWAALAALPRRQREAVALRYVADLSEAQVADFMGVAEGTASAALSAARRRLAADLEHLKELRWT